jgi:crossover junction endodeoxyribonuclease RuvC
MTVIGLDLSLTHTGVCVLSDEKTDVFSIKSKPSGDSHKDELLRIKGIVSKIEEAVVSHKVDLVVLEGLAFMARNTTALVQLSGLNYLVRDMAHRNQIDFLVVAPSSLKKFITGKGNSQKDHVMLALYKNYDITLLDNNEADAYGLAKCGRVYLGDEEALNQAQKEVVTLLNKQ